MRALIAATKYRNNRAALGWLADQLAGLLEELGPPQGAVVTWAPTSGARRRQRGYDQAELLARRVARVHGAACRGLLRRRPGPALVGLAPAERSAAVAFVARSAVPQVVIVVDDVITTGSTMTAAAEALRGAGAVDLIGVAAAWTPPPAPRQSRDTRVVPTTTASLRGSYGHNLSPARPGRSRPV